MMVSLSFNFTNEMKAVPFSTDGLKNLALSIKYNS